MCISLQWTKIFKGKMHVFLCAHIFNTKIPNILRLQLQSYSLFFYVAWPRFILSSWICKRRYHVTYCTHASFVCKSPMLFIIIHDGINKVTLTPKTVIYRIYIDVDLIKLGVSACNVIKISCTFHLLLLEIKARFSKRKWQPLHCWNIADTA